MQQVSSFQPHSNTTKVKQNWSKWIIVLILILIAIYFITRPIRISSANKYIDSGDQFLMQKKYLSADLEYRKAISINNDKKAIERRNLVQDIETDITKLKSMLEEKNNTALLDKFTSATEVPQNESDAVKLSKKLIEENEYQLAILPAKTAIEMDKDYRDAWLYLGIANIKAASTLELTPEIKEQYLNTGKEALNKALSLDPEYQPTKDYLKEADNM